jgi:hypothetical protein
MTIYTFSGIGTHFVHFTGEAAPEGAARKKIVKPKQIRRTKL